MEYETEKFVHSSDLNGPVIEDYAQQIIRENPQVLILDGPMAYMFGYSLNRISLNRAVENAAAIVWSIDAELIIYDYHLPRERRFRERTEKVCMCVRLSNPPIHQPLSFDIWLASLAEVNVV